MSEGKFYFVDWCIQNGIHKLQLQKNKDLFSESDNLDQAKEDLCSRICIWNGDGEAHLELVPETVLNDTWVKIAPEKDLWLKNFGPDLYTHGLCDSCNLPQGERTKIQLESSTKMTGAICYFSNTLQHMNVYSSDFLSKLQTISKFEFNISPVLYKGENSSYYEILNSPSVNSKVKIGLDIDLGARTTFECGVCGIESYHFKGKSFKDIYLAKEDLENSDFVIVESGRLRSRYLAAKNSVVSQLGRTKLKDRFHTSDITVLKNSELYSPDSLPIVSEVDWS
jgi:hypothetical protein